jgi:phosphatidate cytidylyltransferase
MFGGRNLFLATGVAIGLLSYVIITLVWFRWGLVIFVAGFLMLGVRELVKVTLRASAKPLGAILLVITPVLFIAAYASSKQWSGLLVPMAVILGGTASTMLLLASWRLLGPVENYVSDLAAAALILLYVPLLGSSIVLLLVDSHPVARVAITLACVVSNDSGAFIFGVLAGRRPGGNHHIAPRVSPAKSWEGFAGGVLLSVVVAIAFGVPLLQLTWWGGVLLGVAVGVAGVLGDLVESMIKRNFGVKDMGQLIPGHGGAMDRLDSVLFAFPVSWALLLVLVP